MAKAEADALIEEMFKADVDQNGSLSKSEIKNYMEQHQHGDVKQEDVKQFIEAIDQNSDNMLSRAEVTQRIYELFGVE